MRFPGPMAVKSACLIAVGPAIPNVTAGDATESWFDIAYCASNIHFRALEDQLKRPRRCRTDSKIISWYDMQQLTVAYRHRLYSR